MTIDFDAARRAADALANDIASRNGVEYCPIEKTGLIVLVYGGVDDDAIPDIRVTVGDSQIHTSANGIAHFIVGAGSHTVKVISPEDSRNLIPPDHQLCQVKLNDCLVLPMRMQSAVTFRVQKMVGGSATEFEGARLTLKDLVEGATVLKNAQALVTFVIPKPQPGQEKSCEVLWLSPDGTDDIYEVEE